jgi:hypothetical protein
MMAPGLSVALALLAQTGSAFYGPEAPAKPATAVTAAEKQCVPPAPTANSDREVIVCAVKPQGYRIDPDVMAARKAKKRQMAGRPRAPENFKQNNCAAIGPMGCRGGPTINLLAAAATAAEMAKRLSNGQEIGSMFVTDPQKTEYEMYKEAKAEREAKEAEAAAKAKAKAAATAAATPPATP